ncbi:hypothetical protein ACFS07_08880 [Undibacterium arcticum]
MTSLAGFAWYFSNKYYLLVRNDAKAHSLAEFSNDPKLQLGVIRSFRYGNNANRMVDKLDAEQRVSYASGLDPLYQVLGLNRIQAMIIEPFDYADIESGQIRALTSTIEINDESIAHGLIMSKKRRSRRSNRKKMARAG